MEAIEKKLKKLDFTFPVGINIAKTNRADIKGEKSVEDYVATYKQLAHYFSYVTLNVSCPNAQDGVLFQDPAMLDALLSAFSREPKVRPVFLKLSTHLSMDEVDAILAVVEKYNWWTGLCLGILRKIGAFCICGPHRRSSTPFPHGGISGAPLNSFPRR